MNILKIYRRAQHVSIRAREEGMIGTAKIAVARLRSAAFGDANPRYIDFSTTPLRELLAILKDSSIRPIKIRSIHLEATRYCNLRCAGCMLTTNIESGLWSYNHMKFDDFKVVCTNLPAARVLTLHNLGEPSMNPHLRDMVAFATATGKFDVVTITTNLLTRNAEYFLGLFGAGLSEMTVSVDSFDPEIAEKVRSRTNVDRLKIALRQVVKRHASKLTVAIVASKMNLHDIDNTLAILEEMVGETGKQLNVSLIKFDYSSAPQLRHWSLDSVDYEFLSEKLLEWDKKFVHLTIKPPSGDDQPAASELCDLPWVAPKVTQEGILAVCGLHIEPAVSEEISDLKRRSFSEIVRDPQMISFLESFIGEAPQYCIGCANDCSRSARGAAR